MPEAILSHPRVTNHPRVIAVAVALMAVLAVIAVAVLSQHGAAPHFGAYLYHGVKPDYLYQG